MEVFSGGYSASNFAGSAISRCDATSFAIHWLFRCLISASIHGYFRLVPHESALDTRGYEHAYPGLEGRKGVVAGVTLRQRLQQRLRILQVCRIKPLGKPVIHRGEQAMGFLALALLLPQAAQAHGGA
jgi:hypothetical protein